jgi:Ca2+/Na+ antiporter
MGMVRIIGEVLGGLAATIFITRLFYWIIYKSIFRKKINRKIGVICSSLVSLIFIYAVKKPHFVINDFRFIYIYIPCLICLLFYDLYLSPAGKKT